MDFRDIVYHSLKISLAGPFYSLYHVRTSGDKDLPKPAIVVSNHVSYLDPLFIIAALPKKDPIHFVAMPLGGYRKLYELTGQIVLSSGNDFYRKAIEVLKKDRYLAVFPEGKRSSDGGLEDFNDGASSIAIRAQVPIIPVYIHGAYDSGKKFPIPFRNIEVRFGRVIEPVKEKGRQAAKKLTQVVFDEIQRLSR